MKKFEYKIIISQQSLKKTFNELGILGWELCNSTIYEHGSIYYIFKREII